MFKPDFVIQCTHVHTLLFLLMGNSNPPRSLARGFNNPDILPPNLMKSTLTFARSIAAAQWALSWFCRKKSLLSSSLYFSTLIHGWRFTDSAQIRRSEIISTYKGLKWSIKKRDKCVSKSKITLSSAPFYFCTNSHHRKQQPLRTTKKTHRYIFDRNVTSLVLFTTLAFSSLC